MRRAPTFTAAASVALLALTGVAAALPTVKFKAEAVPIPHFRGTGNILGAGAAVQAEYQITGTEYLGSPPPIIGVNFYLPKGSKLHRAAFLHARRRRSNNSAPSSVAKAPRPGRSARCSAT
jgi:hypothetical protein